MDVDKIIETKNVQELRNEYQEIPELNFGGFDWNQTVNVAQNRLFLITEYDKVRMIYLSQQKSQVRILPTSGIQRSRFTVYHIYGECDIVTIGGIDVTSDEKLKICKRFDVWEMKWHEMPELRMARESPGMYKSRDGQYYYVFGGKQHTAERLKIEGGQEWELLNIALPNQLSTRGGFSMFPMWSFPFTEPEDLSAIPRDCLVVFGAYAKECYIYNPSNCTFLLAKQELSSREFLSNLLFSNKNKKLELLKEDVVDVQPVVVTSHKKLILIGNYNIHIVDLRSFETDLRKEKGSYYV